MEYDQISTTIECACHPYTDDRIAISNVISTTACDVPRESDGVPIAAARELLRSMMLARDQVRSGRGDAGTQPRLWPALLAGQWRLVDSFTMSRTRYVIACKNRESDMVLRALRPREQCVLELSLDGRAGKWIALELGLSESTVSRARRAAVRRIGLADDAALAAARTAVFEPLDGLPPDLSLAVTRLNPAESTALSAAECVVVEAILSGKHLAAIADERGTAPRTVSNQLASIYRKLGVGCRRGVIAALSDRASANSSNESSW